MRSKDQDSDIIRYVRKHGKELIGLRYFTEIVNLADQIQDVRDSREKFNAELRKNLPLIEAQVEAWQGLLDRIAPKG